MSWSALQRHRTSCPAPEALTPTRHPMPGKALGLVRATSPLRTHDPHPALLAPDSLVQLYVDIEMTDRHNTFYEKFTTRYQIGEIMAYLWQLPQVRGQWAAAMGC